MLSDFRIEIQFLAAKVMVFFAVDDYASPLAGEIRYRHNNIAANASGLAMWRYLKIGSP